MRFVLASFFVCLNTFAAVPAKVLGTLPMRFEPGAKQWTAHGYGYAVSFTNQATTLHLGDRNVRLSFAGADPSAQWTGLDRASAGTNYFRGSSRVSVPAFQRLRQTGVYLGVDVVYYGNGQQLEYDFEVAPGADPSRIRMRFAGADSVQLNRNGEIVLTLGGGEIVQRAPVVYQRTRQGEIVAVNGSYQIDRHGVVRVKLGAYDRTKALIVDPVVTYSAYLAGSHGADTAIEVGHDSKGFVYLAGDTSSSDFILAGDSEQTAYKGLRDVWVMKFDFTQPGGQQLVYSTYLGGSEDDDVQSMTVDANGRVYLTGSTTSADFPVQNGAQTTLTANTHAFVTMLDPSQSGAAGLIYSTYLGGGGTLDVGTAVAAAGGKIYVAGYTNSSDFPVGAGFQANLAGGFDAFVTELDPAQTGSASRIVSTYLGGSARDIARAIAVDSAGKVYVAGTTFSFDFPLGGAPYDSTYAADGDAFLVVMDFSGGGIPYGTFLGGSSEDEAKKIVIDPNGLVAVTGYTLSPDFPVTQGAAQTSFGGNGNAFLSILDTHKDGQGLIYSTYFGGTGGEVAYDLKRDKNGLYYMSGYTYSIDLPVTQNALNISSIGQLVDGFVAVIDPSAAPFSPNALVYSSYITSLGFTVAYGVDVDDSGTVYLTGLTTSNVFDPGQAQRNGDNGKLDAFLMVLTLP